ncbi:MAG TPA: permease prefix domain 1-containing protein [Gemmatimonadales bacterium]|nr:permease prefix domain 1-containing protein [Gemmatimonadales bacterium]
MSAETNHSTDLEAQIDQWRNFLRRRQAIHSVDVNELEDHLREQVGNLVAAGLAEDEAFLVAVKRMGSLDTLSREFAQEHSDRLWKQLVVTTPGAIDTVGDRRDGLVAFALAVAAAVLVKLPILFGITLDGNEFFYMHNMPFFVLPLLTGYFAWKRRLSHATIRWLGAGFIAAMAVMNLMPFVPQGSTEVLAVLHLPIALWLLVGVAYAGGRWHETSGRMDFIRFSGELFIYYALIAMGGGVLTAFLMATFESIGLDAEYFFGNWMLPCGALGAVLVASWLVEAKQSVIENMAPVLTRLFTPLFAALLLAFLGAMLITGNGIAVERELLILFDALLIVVLALLLYTISARDPQAPPGPFDWLQLVLVLSALAANGFALWAMLARIAEMGFTPNRTAGLGMNLILIVNLAWSAVLSLRFIRGKGSVTALEEWQTSYVPVYSLWAVIVVVGFPVIFGFA